MERVKGEVWSVDNPLDFNKYQGEYLALVNGRIIAHGRNFKKVQEQAMKISKEPVFTKIPNYEVTVL